MNTIELTIHAVAARAEGLVGSVGSQTVDVEPHGSTLSISRGGVLVINQSYGEHFEASRRHHLRTGSNERGDLAYPDAGIPEEAFFDPTIIHIACMTSQRGNRLPPNRADFLLHEDQIGAVWFAERLGKSGALLDPYNRVHTYFLGDAKPIRTEENIMALQGLLDLFERGIEARRSDALRFANTPIPQP